MLLTAKARFKPSSRIKKHLSEVVSILVDGGYTGQPFAEAVHNLFGASVQVAKRNERHTFAVIHRR